MPSWERCPCQEHQRQLLGQLLLHLCRCAAEAVRLVLCGCWCPPLLLLAGCCLASSQLEGSGIRLSSQGSDDHLQAAIWALLLCRLASIDGHPSCASTSRACAGSKQRGHRAEAAAAAFPWRSCHRRCASTMIWEACTAAGSHDGALPTLELRGHIQPRCRLKRLQIYTEYPLDAEQAPGHAEVRRAWRRV